VFELPTAILATDYVTQMASKGVLCVPFGKHLVRFVTHLNFNDDQLTQLEQHLKT
jgi:threonine aldolase